MEPNPNSLLVKSLEETIREIDKTPKRFVLLFSEEASKFCGANVARQDDGTEVTYTCMHDEAVNGPWTDCYKWVDAKVVGGIDSYSQVIKYGLHSPSSRVFADFLRLAADHAM